MAHRTKAEELLQKNGRYAELFHLQAKGYNNGNIHLDTI